ncbi:MAG: hypothetical protein RIQ88_819 [Actinomycetota bacterium]|jgi:pilus assembly protein CpaF
MLGKTPAEFSQIWQHLAMDPILKLTERARELITATGTAVDSAITKTLDEAFEAEEIKSSSDLTSAIRAQLTGLGSLEALVADASIEEIWLNSPNQIFISRNSKTERLALTLTEFEVRQAVERMLRDTGRRLDKSQPFVDATLSNGSRLHVVIPEVTSQHWAINIRKFNNNLLTLQDLTFRGSISTDLAKYLEKAFHAGVNILISGATQAGKTTFLCALLDVGYDTERLISVEETFEIRTRYFDWVAMQSRQANLEGIGEINLRRLVREALRMRPTRLVIGEVRQAEALDLLIALNSGIAGLCTIHANSASHAIAKLKLLPLLAGENMPAHFIEQTVEQTIGLVVHCVQLPDGRRKVAEVIAKDAETARWKQVSL